MQVDPQEETPPSACLEPDTSDRQQRSSPLSPDRESISISTLDTNDYQILQQSGGARNDETTEPSPIEAPAAECGSHVEPKAPCMRPEATETGPQHCDKQDGATDALVSMNPERKRQKLIRKLKRLSTRTWAWEFFCWLVSFASMMAVIIILRVYNGKALPQWPLGITINAAISVHLVIVGALIIISGNIAFGPMTQQVVTYPLRMVPSSETATVRRVQNYTVVSSPAHTDENSGLADPTMKSAIYTGLFLNENATISAIMPTCPTGNCTWPTYYTLGACAGVADLTSQLKSTCPDKIGSIDTCEYTLPNDVTLAKDKNMIITNGKAMTFTGLNEPVAHFFMVYKDLNATYGSGGGNNYYDWDFYIGANALECAIRFCVLSVNTTVTQGQPHTELTEVRTNASHRNPFTLSKVWFELWLEPEDQDMAYIIPQGSREAITTWTYDVFNGTSTQGSRARNLYTSDVAQVFAAAMQMRPRSERKTAVSNIMRNIASSMTNNIRTYGDGDFAMGSSLSAEVFVSVQWEWLTLPLALIGLSLIVLVSTIVKARRLGAKVWKSSSLAILLGFNVDTRKRMPDLDHKDILDNSTKGVVVSLEDSGDHTWSIVRC
ncbi:hypothetical protein CPC735_071160 [Coccidioides posadasii C735 delta SOWgp]|uniref:Uncharacterized protein n=1 Tax=Coccidioides posadasii (strain C735) TaxID=222929 RepID=C5P176_COCP7|nr:hypothetical protein CPC735_071160 [Coccidioides posadasii C735 delta SOWgp]EER29434.1 hypothetical protein CPC735_071160 [Coccidioides posadasii C735 delta SOWgp]|eukprot:XP_003071579.1 hypothetical protein CPC735_071160 [Coccidioides posadasii C735 delta SOWgp]